MSYTAASHQETVHMFYTHGLESGVDIKSMSQRHVTAEVA